MKKKKILLLSDDISFPSGVGVMSKEIIYNTLHHYDWVQIGGAADNPNKGKILNLSESCNKELKLTDAYLVLYPTVGYGDRDLLMQVIQRESPDVIMHFTDPRYWVWLYQIAHEFRSSIPLVYYNIWDNLPYCHWNKPFYLSCDLIMNISKQTKVIVDVVTEHAFPPEYNTYVPHGINSNVFRPLTADDSYILYDKLYKNLFGDKKFKFIVFYNNRNIRRKRPADLILAYKYFIHELPENERSDCALLMHTDLIDNNGTDLNAVISTIAPDYNIYVTNKKFTPAEMNILYNIASVTCNIANAEGFGLSNAESIMAGTMTVAIVTGGLQDQMRFEDDNGNWFNPTEELPTNHRKTHLKCGEWTIPIWPATRVLAGSVTTPYIFEDIADHIDIANAIRSVYYINPVERSKKAAKGREWMLSEGQMSHTIMADNIIKNIDYLLDNKRPANLVNLTKINLDKDIKKHGIIF